LIAASVDPFIAFGGANHILHRAGLQMGLRQVESRGALQNPRHGFDAPSWVSNGLLAPPLMVLVMLVGGNRKIMGEHVNGFWLNLLGWIATGVMTAAAVAFFLTAGG
jgi:hypothetical protein